MALSTEVFNPDPLSSYQFPVTVPSIDPMDGTFVEVQFPEEYGALVLGCLLQLLQTTTWDTDDPDEIGTAIVRANQLIYLFQERTLLIPPGSIIEFGGADAPTGWTLCDGSALSRSDFAALFSAIGEIYGPGDGSTTFNVPDFRGRVAVGYGTGTGLSTWSVGDTAGTEVVELDISTLPTHAHAGEPHTHSIHSHLSGLAVSPGELPVSLPGIVPELTSAATASSDYEGGGEAHANLQPLLVVAYIIKT